MSLQNADLSSLFLGDGKFDNELDEIFKANKTEVVPSKQKEQIQDEENKEGEGTQTVVEQGIKISLETDSADSKQKAMKPGKSDPEVQKRTIFVGNLSVEALTKGGRKILITAFKKFGKVESIRFRSLALEKFMNRKAAYINKKLNPKRSTVNCYIVFEDSESVEDALQLNATILFEKHIRVDHNDQAKKDYPKKKSVFVGNLPFEIEEEPLWQHFSTCGKVEGVRVVRDNKTNLGKGFAYVLFQDEAAVQLALKLHETKLENRKIRVTKCTAAYKTNPADPNHKKLQLAKQIVMEGERASKSKGLDAKPAKRARPNRKNMPTKAAGKTKKPRTKK